MKSVAAVADCSVCKDCPSRRQYITNYGIPAIGTYRVEILVGNVCGIAATQRGSRWFISPHITRPSREVLDRFRALRLNHRHGGTDRVIQVPIPP